jgi:hypothetical protein
MSVDARDIYVAIAEEMRSRKRMSWKGNGKYCAVRIRRIVPIVS